MPHPRLSATHRALTAVALLGALALTGCTPSGDGPAEGEGPASGASGSQGSHGSPGNGTPAAVPAGLEDFYAQEPDWQSCEQDAGDFDCATVEAPLDYADPDGERIELALVRAGTTQEGAPHLLLNQGGPGASGVDMVVDSLDAVTSAAVRDHYTVVGFDPRGVGRSAPVTCLSDAEMDASRQEYVDPSTQEGLEEVLASAEEFAAACDANTGEVLGHVDTVSAAQDMDLLRAVLGDDRLNYLGYSYGTELGASYADQFPQNVGRMVLDGAMDPALAESEVLLGQAAAFEDAIHAWAESCLSGPGCPLSGTPEDGVEQLRDLIAQVEASPLTASDGRQVPAATFVSGLMTPLYADENWPVLSGAIADAMQGNPDTILYLADLGAGREEDGTYSSNLNDAFTAVTCLDAPVQGDPASLREQAEALDEASPTIGRFLAYSAATCAAWPEGPVSTPAPASAPGAAPILVIGTTGDPATPYEWAPALAEQLESGVLLTWNGEGHTAYGRAGQCIGSAVDGYLVDGTVPEDGLECD